MLITMNEMDIASYKPVKEETQRKGLYAAREPIAVCIHVAKHVVKGRNQWRRVYTLNGRLYIWVDAAIHYLDDAVTAAVGEALASKTKRKASPAEPVTMPTVITTALLLDVKSSPVAEWRLKQGVYGDHDPINVVAEIDYAGKGGKARRVYKGSYGYYVLIEGTCVFMDTDANEMIELFI